MIKRLLHKSIVLAAVSVAFIGCGGGSSSGKKDPYKIVKVGYKLNGSAAPSCPTAFQTTVSKAQKANGIGYATCTWICGEYEGGKPLSVVLSFTQDGKDLPWKFEGDTVQTAPSKCHN